MNTQSNWKRRTAGMFVVAPASPTTWAVAFSRQLIPGAIFHSKAAALIYTIMLAGAAGLDVSQIKVLGA